jgi:hypothetical protein
MHSLGIIRLAFPFSGTNAPAYLAIGFIRLTPPNQPTLLIVVGARGSETFDQKLFSRMTLSKT